MATRWRTRPSTRPRVAVVQFLVDHQFDGGGDDHDRDGGQAALDIGVAPSNCAASPRAASKAVVAGRVRYMWVPYWNSYVLTYHGSGSRPVRPAIERGAGAITNLLLIIVGAAGALASAEAPGGDGVNEKCMPFVKLCPDRRPILCRIGIPIGRNLTLIVCAKGNRTRVSAVANGAALYADRAAAAAPTPSPAPLPPQISASARPRAAPRRSTRRLTVHPEHDEHAEHAEHDELNTMNTMNANTNDHGNKGIGRGRWVSVRDRGWASDEK